MVYTDEHKSKVFIYSGRIANELLRRGYHIVEVRPDKRNKIKTVFLFQVEKDIEKHILSLTEAKNIF